MGKMFDLLKEGLEEAIVFEKGLSTKAKAKKLRIDNTVVPLQPKEYKASDIKRLRNKLNCSQALLAAYLNVSLNTVQAWEQGVRFPNHAALRLLEVLYKGPVFLTSLTRTSSRKVI